MHHYWYFYISFLKSGERIYKTLLLRYKKASSTGFMANYFCDRNVFFDAFYTVFSAVHITELHCHVYSRVMGCSQAK